MTKKKDIFAIFRSAGENFATQKLIEALAGLISEAFNVIIVTDLKTLPHLDPELTTNEPPAQVTVFRTEIERADGILICTPYMFSAFQADC